MNGTLYSYLSNIPIFSASCTTIYFLSNGTSSPSGPNGSGWVFSNVNNLTIQGLRFQYKTTPTVRTDGGSPLAITNSTNVFLSDIAVLNSVALGLEFILDTGLQANRIRVQNTLADGIQNQDMIGMLETNLNISNTGDDGLAMHCANTSSSCFSSVPNYGIAANIVEDQIGTNGNGGKGISIDGGKGITVNGLKATNIAGDCVDVYTDGFPISMFPMRSP